MQQHDIRGDQVMQVRGFADQRPRKPEAPLDPSNRRVSLIVEYLDKTADSEKNDPATDKEGTASPESQPATAPPPEH